VRTLELRRHAPRDPDDDRLSPEGRALAAEVARTLGGGYDAVFVSPARRAAETAHIFTGRQDVAVEQGLATDGDPGQLAAIIKDLLALLPEGARGLAVGHTPLIEKAAQGLTARRPEPLAECEGVLIVEEAGSYSVEELRR
jgi:phosphohistidine phosphatase SixA